MHIWKLHKAMNILNAFNDLFFKYQTVLAVLQKIDRDSNKLLKINNVLNKDKL